MQRHVPPYRLCARIDVPRDDSYERAGAAGCSGTGKVHPERMRRVTRRRSRALVLSLCAPGLLAMVCAAHAEHLTESAVAELAAACEAARERHIAPLRQQAIEECIARGDWDAARCTRFHADYGDAIRTPSGMQPRRFLDLPECVAADEADKHFRLYPP